MPPKKAPPPLRMIPLDRIHESPLNPRREYPDDGEELVKSIRAQGVIQPILVRPAKVAGGGDVPSEYELVCGHRRCRAAREADLEEIPAFVRELSDEQAVEAALVENAARRDIHPMEEAEALQRLIEQHGHTVDQLAERLGKSRASIYARLKLAALGPEGRKAMYEGLIDFSRGLLLARIPDPRLQAQATKEVLAGDHQSDGPLHYRQALQLIRRKYMLELKDAPWDIHQGDLVPAAGACAACPKRTGAQPELFADVSGADVCTDTACWAKKLDAHWKKLQKLAKEEGRPVLSQQEAKEVFRWGDNPGYYGSKYMELDQHVYDDPKARTVRQLLKHAPDVQSVLARSPSGAIKELLPKKALEQLLKANGVKRASGISGWEAKARKQRKAEREQRKQIAPVLEAAVTRLVQEARVRKPDETFWRILAELLIESLSYRVDTVAQRRKLEVELPDAVEAMNERDLRGLVFEIAIPSSWVTPWRGAEVPEELEDLCRDFGVDLAAIKTELAPAEKPKKGGTKKRKASGSDAGELAGEA